MIANFAAMDIRPGSMGRPLRGIEAAIVRQGPSGSIEEILEPDIQGELALRPGWPSMFRENAVSVAGVTSADRGDAYGSSETKVKATSGA